MTNNGVYMNLLTMKIKSKGYSLSEFCSHVGISLRTYRRWEKIDSKFHNLLNSKIDLLEVRK